MADNRPRGRKRNVSGQGTGVNLRGDGLGTGPVGSGISGKGSSGSGGGSRGGRGMGGLPLIVLIIIALLGGGGSLGGLLGGGSSGGSSSSYSPTGNNWNVQEATAISISITVPTAETVHSPRAGRGKTPRRRISIQKWLPARERSSRRSRAAARTM